MELPVYLKAQPLSGPVNYEWTRAIATHFMANPAEEHPKLDDAIQMISVKAAFALSVACAEWIVARLETHADVSDSVQRIEAAWAATIDPRYAVLPKPTAPASKTPDPVLEPLWLMQNYLHLGLRFYEARLRGEVNRGVHNSALRIALVAQHIYGRRSAFEKWLTAVLRVAHQRFPNEGKPPQDEPAVPRGIFDPGFKWSDDAADEWRALLVPTLDPATNPYLRSRDDMRAGGFAGDPYSHLK